MEDNRLDIKLFDGEHWWGGLVQDGILMPYGSIDFSRDLSEEQNNNQSAPLLISNHGRFVWSDEPFKFSFNKKTLNLESSFAAIEYGEGHENLREVFRYVSAKYFPPTAKHPDSLLFTSPQYNTWIEMMYEPSEDKVIQYAQSILENKMPPGVLMIDDNWQEDYGVWRFHPGRFPNPKPMVDALHKMGFKVMLWVCNFISPDSQTFRALDAKGFLVKDSKGNPAISNWWNGYSGVLDTTNKDAVNWLYEQFDTLMDTYGIDGFKLDAGDLNHFSKDYVYKNQTHANGLCESWAKVGLRYELNEYRACWKMGGQPLAQRLSDKYHSWENDGLASLIPNGLAQGLLGYAFSCPDMIGGGDFLSFLNLDDSFDEELFVRYAQCSALFPMMQFSAAPWRVLSKENLSYCIETVNLHKQMEDTILQLVKHSAKTGEPIIRHMEYVFPQKGYEKISDQFMLGDDILVAPVLKKGATGREIVFPEGIWVGDDGTTVYGQCTKVVEAPISRLPWYKRNT